MGKYVQRYNDEPFEVPSGALHRIKCCDCGLVHDRYFHTADGKPVSITANRNNRATAQHRRKKGKR